MLYSNIYLAKRYLVCYYHVKAYILVYQAFSRLRAVITEITAYQRIFRSLCFYLPNDYESRRLERRRSPAKRQEEEDGEGFLQQPFLF